MQLPLYYITLLYFFIRFVKQDQICVAKFQTAGIVCMETFAEFPQMGRFTLRDEGRSSTRHHRACPVWFGLVWELVVTSLFLSC